MTIKEEFFAEAFNVPFNLIADYVPGLYLFAKDLEGRMVMANQRTVIRCGCRNEAEVLGRRDEDFFSAELSAKYAADDRAIFSTGQPIVDLSELAFNEVGNLDWFITNKFPVFNRRGIVIGLIGTTIQYTRSMTAYTHYSDIYPAIKHLQENYSSKISLIDLATSVNLSVRQFQRKFKERFQVNIQEYLIRLRIYRACDLLSASQNSLSEIALETGFYDQSSFSRQFKKHMGITPLKYRKNKKNH